MNTELEETTETKVEHPLKEKRLEKTFVLSLNLVVKMIIGKTTSSRVDSIHFLVSFIWTFIILYS